MTAEVLKLKPFDKVLVRVNDFNKWEPDFYWRKGTKNKWFNKVEDDYETVTIYYTIGDKFGKREYKECIPYEGNEHLLGTIDKPNLDQIITDRQIRQNAEVWAEEHKMRTDFGYGWPETYDTKQQADAYIAGAHSRDKEISQLEFDNYLLRKKIEVYEEALDRLRNPWISVNDETNRPQIGEQIIIAYGHDARNILKYTGKELFEIWNAHHWMHVQGLKKEDKNECK